MCGSLENDYGDNAGPCPQPNSSGWDLDQDGRSVPDECLRNDPIAECHTCCCKSSDNVEFYNHNAPEPECTAPPALYEIDFVFTWNETCHPDYYSNHSWWTDLFGISHDVNYRLWATCMENVRDRQSRASRTKNMRLPEMKLRTTAIAGGILDASVNFPVKDGFGISKGDLIIDKFHQWVSASARLMPSSNLIVGMSDLRLCDDDTWKERVKVCFELFCTGTYTSRVGSATGRNSWQANNCSFGYVELYLKKTQSFEPRSALDKTCYPMVPKECPRNDPISECPTCCCESSENVEFYNPDAAEPECTAQVAVYKMNFTFTWSPTCHPDYYFLDAAWTSPFAVSHNTVYRMWDACMDDPSLGVTLMSQLDGTSVINQEYLAAGDNALANAVGELTFGGIGTASQNLTLDKDHQFVSAVLMLAPSVDHMVGVADLRLCDGDQWKTKVKVCLELFSTATVSTRVAGEMERNSLQANNCSFGYVEFTLLEPLNSSIQPLNNSIHPLKNSSAATSRVDAAVAVLTVVFMIRY